VQGVESGIYVKLPAHFLNTLLAEGKAPDRKTELSCLNKNTASPRHRGLGIIFSIPGGGG
jgi:hypothetical protein